MYLGGLDVGTSGCKVTIYDEKGNFIENHYSPYQSIHFDGLHEIDANEILKGVKSVLESLETTPDILGLTSFGETFVAVDENDNILCNSMLYTDPRGEKELEVFNENIEKVKSITYYAPGSMYSIPKIMWLKNNKPEIYNKAKHIFLIEDFIIYCLTKKACINYSLASRTMGLDINKKIWSKEIFDMAGIDISKMSEPVESGTIVGISNEFGLKNTKIMAGCHDQTAAAIGSGAIKSGTAVDGSGSVECITPVFSKLPDNTTICDSGYPFIPFVNNQYVCYALSFNGGTALKWFKENFASQMEYSDLDKAVDRRRSHVLALPYFSGAASPYMDLAAEAMFMGVNLETTKYDLYLAIMEGVAFEMRVNLEKLKEYNISPTELFATGGGSKSPIWLQIKADVTGLPITPIDAQEAGTLGIITFCSVVSGIYKSLDEAVKVFVKKGKTYYPDNDAHEKYNELFKSYSKMYEYEKCLRK